MSVVWSIHSGTQSVMAIWSGDLVIKVYGITLFMAFGIMPAGYIFQPLTHWSYIAYAPTNPVIFVYLEQIKLINKSL